MRLSTVALSLLAFGIASVAGAQPDAAAAGLSSRAEVAASRDFARKMEVRNPKKHKKSRAEKLITNGMMTWYGGGQLSAPACGGKTPSKHDHVAAVKQGGQFKCGDEVHLHHKGKMVKAKVVDYCEGCADNHVDVSQGVFEQLASLDEGEIHNMHIRIIPN